MVKLLIWAGLLYMGVRFVMKMLFTPSAPKDNEVKGQRRETPPSFDLNDVEDAHFKDVMPDGDTDDETTQA